MSKNIYILLAFFTGLQFFVEKATSQNVSIEISPTVKRSIGSVSQLDRTKYFNIHSTGIDVEESFYTDYNVSNSGRGFWGPAAYAFQQEGEVGVYPDPKTGNSDLREVSRYISTEHPNKIYKEGIDKVALADWTVEYFKNFVDVSLRPEFYEPMNEPFVHARDFYNEPDWDPVAEARVKLEMTQVFRTIAQKIHDAPELNNMKVIGYAAAFPSFEKNDFGTWQDNMKMFMDEAGADMDAIATHLYDGINQVGQDTKRSGSNVEAIMDLIETYSHNKWGTIKAHAISEFGGVESSTVYSDLKNIQSIRSQNAMLFSLLDRENRMEISIPFTTGKSTWHLTQENNYLPYKAVLYKPIPLGVPLDQVTDWEYTDRIYFYDLWKNVSGERIWIQSDNPDIQVQAFKNGEKLYVALNNLDDFSQTVDLSLLGELPAINEVRTKSLIVHTDISPEFTDVVTVDAPTSKILSVGETVVIEYTFASSFPYKMALQSKANYSTDYMKAIVANNPLNFSFNNVKNGSGYASLKMAIGRAIGASKAPVVMFNGSALTVPTNWKGYDQSNRDDFFGVIEIPVSMSLIQTNNTITIQFPDTGGHVSSLILENTLVVGDIDVEPEVNFTTEEGFSALETDLMSAVDWDTKYQTNPWRVTGDLGQSSCDSEYRNAVWAYPFVLNGENDFITIRTEFQFSGALEDVTSKLMTFGFRDTFDAITGTENIFYLSTNSFEDGNIQLRSNLNTPLSFSDSNVNLPLATNKNWAIEYTLTLGSDETNSTMQALLINESDDTQTSIGSYSGITPALYSAATSGGVYAKFGSASYTENGQGVTKVFVDRILRKDAVLSINKPSLATKKIKIYPNSSTGVFQINGIQRETIIAVFSMFGKQVFSSIYKGEFLDVSHLPKGIYILKIENETFKIIKK